MNTTKRKEGGSIDKKHEPVIYIDGKFGRDYILAEGAEGCWDENSKEIIPPEEGISSMTPSTDELINKLIRDLVKPSNNIKTFGAIRHIATNYLSTASLIVTPMTMLEIRKEHAKNMFKEYCAHSIGIEELEKMSEKETSKYLAELLARYRKNKDDKIVKEVIVDCSINMSYLRAHGLSGISYIDDLTLHITDEDINSFLWKLSLVQVSTSNILHLHAAKQLNCKYFATLDDAINGNKEMIEDGSEIKILGSAEEVLEVLRSHSKGGSNE